VAGFQPLRVNKHHLQVVPKDLAEFFIVPVWVRDPAIEKDAAVIGKMAPYACRQRRIAGAAGLKDRVSKNQSHNRFLSVLGGPKEDRIR